MAWSLCAAREGEAPPAGAGGITLGSRLRPAECQKDTAGGTQPVAAEIPFSPELPAKGNTEGSGDTSQLAVLPVNQAFREQISSGTRPQW